MTHTTKTANVKKVILLLLHVAYNVNVLRSNIVLFIFAF